MAVKIVRRRFSVEDYHKMMEAGILQEKGIELINGEIVEMSPIGSKHLSCVNTLTELLFEALGRKAIVSVQNPIQVNEFNEPVPDIALLKRREDRYVHQLPSPSDILLIIEVADTSLRYDREVKLPLYAAAGIPEFWLVNLAQSEIEIFWQPTGDAYKFRELLRPGDVARARELELELAVNGVLQ